jgi:1-acyl-sn-glycerol-3-phosphate acyltransferase
MVFGSLALAASLFDKHGRLQHRIARVWARASVFLSGSGLQVIGLENIPAETAVFASNHTSYMDTPVVFASLPFQFRILAKKELWGLPFIGWYLDRSGQIPIDTENPRTTLSSFAAGVRTLRDGLSVFVFPEGGRTPDGNLKTFLNGAAFLAIRAKVPLVPIALIGVRELLPIPHTPFLPITQPYAAQTRLRPAHPDQRSPPPRFGSPDRRASRGHRQADPAKQLTRTTPRSQATECRFRPPFFASCNAARACLTRSEKSCLLFSRVTTPMLIVT